MRVALFTPEITSSYGWARYALEMGRALSQQGVEIVAITQPTPAEHFSWLTGVRPVLPMLVPRSRGFLIRSLLAAPRVRRAVADCDVIHVVAEPYTPLAMWAASQQRVVVTAHGTYVPQTARRRWVGSLYRRAYRRAHLIAVSHYTAQQLRAALPDANLTMIHNGVHFERFQKPMPPPDKFGPTVMASGGVKYRKGTHLLVEALAQVRDQIPDVQLVVTGRQDEGAYTQQVRKQIDELGLAQQVHLVGQISEEQLLAWYQHCDVFALPSLNVGEQFEGFGLVFLEASACGRPVIGTLGSGVEEAVLPNETGLLVPQNDVPVLANALIHLLTDAALRHAMGDAGRRYAQSHDWSVVAEQVQRLYQP